MIEKYKQKKIFGYREFLLSETELTTTIHHIILGTVEKKINLLDINYQIESRRINYSERGCLIIAVTYLLVFFLFSVGLNQNTFVTIITIIAFFLVALILNKVFGVHYLEIKTKYEPIILDVNNSTEKNGREFLQKIISNSKTLFRKKYMFVDPDLSTDLQFKNYRWLLINDLINEKEYNDIKDKLKKLKADKNHKS